MAGLHVCKLRPEFGAEITGLNSVTPLDLVVVSQLRALFKERGALVFPDLNPDARSPTHVAEQLVEELPIDPDALHVNELHQVSNVEKITVVRPAIRQPTSTA
jgi:alpha-ketoglutarate-dependent taurine dioxygenase